MFLREAGKRLAGCVLAAAAFIPFQFAHAGGFADLWQFQGSANGDGFAPWAGLLRDQNGNLYGTTTGGGVSAYYTGTVFKVAPDGTETVLYRFCSQTGCPDGAQPYGDLIADPAGNLYGTTSAGGASGGGTIFKLAPDGTETLLHSFGAYTGDGGVPLGGLLVDANGNFYGTTAYGGANSCRGGEIGCGTVYKLASDGTETVLYSFAGGSDGWLPYGKLVMDKSGNLYGTTYSGGGNFTYCDGPEYGCGTVYELTAGGKEKELYAFAGLTDGASPEAGLVLDKSGDLYGTVPFGGADGGGLVFKLAPDGTKTVLHTFAGGTDGFTPVGQLIMDKQGNLYGTTASGGGSASCYLPRRHHQRDVIGCGTVYKLAPDGTETVLHAFASKQGANLAAGLIEDDSGYLYGTAQAGGPGSYCDADTYEKGCGTVFRLKK